jgi:Caspase domain
MGGERTHRLLFAALTLVLAGVLAVPAKLAPSPDRTRIAVGVGPGNLTARRGVNSPSPSAVSTQPRHEHPIQAPAASDPATDTNPTNAPLFDQVFRDRAPVVRAPTTDAARHVYGVIIGINDYPGTTSDLKGAVPDAEDMSDVLALNGVPDTNVRTLLDGDASTKGITEALQWLVSTTAPDSTVVLFYAGHVRKISDDTEAVIAADGGVLPDWYLAKQLQGLPAHDVWIVMAACYGGGFTELLAPGRILTAAADANSLAYENESFGRSYLDEYLVHQALLEGKGAGPTAQQAFAYAQAGLERDYPDRTLTEFDQSTEAISLDGVHRDTPPPSGDSTAPPSGGPVPPTVPPSPGPPTPPSPPPPCRNLLGLLCPPGSR